MDYTKENVRGQYGDLSKFIRTWSEADKKEAIAEALTQQGINLDKLKHDMQLDDVDDHAGEFYTPRAVTDFMAKMIEPKLGESMADKRQAYLIQANGKEKSPKALDIRGFGEFLILDAYPDVGVKSPYS